jgi:hypothetical protein
MTDDEREPRPEPKLRMTEQEALQEYMRLLDELVFFLGREELPYALRTLHQDRGLFRRCARSARPAGREHRERLGWGASSATSREYRDNRSHPHPVLRHWLLSAYWL